MKTVQVGVRLDCGLLGQVDELAKKDKRNRADMIRYIVSTWCETEAKKRKEKTA